MSMQYIRDYYGVPAKRGKRITYQNEPCRIVAAPGHRLTLRSEVDGRRIPHVHPTWAIDYTPSDSDNNTEGV